MAFARDFERHGHGDQPVLGGPGREHAFGVNIRLPHEEGANPFIAQDPKLVENSARLPLDAYINLTVLETPKAPHWSGAFEHCLVS